LIPPPKDALYVSFIFALIFCFLNSFQGVFIFIVSILLKRLELKEFKKKFKYLEPERLTNISTLNTESSKRTSIVEELYEVNHYINSGSVLPNC
jgi:hypothetical protein